MVICAVFNCSNRSDRDFHISFFRFPRIISNRGIEIEELSTKRQKLWLLRISRADISENNLFHKRVCSEHFIQGKPSKLLDETNPDWAPTLKLGHSRYKVNADQATVNEYQITVNEDQATVYADQAIVNEDQATVNGHQVTINEDQTTVNGDQATETCVRPISSEATELAC